MYKGEPKKGIEFYELLEKSEEFTSELGKVTLASGKLEAELINLLEHNNVQGNYKKATLGTLINRAHKSQLIDKNLEMALRMVSTQRNYITHNIYALFIDQIDETILEKNDLLDSDVHLYIERAWQLNKNLNDLSEIIKEMHDIWADCIICDYFQKNEDKQGCQKFEMIGLPERFIVGTNKKCCSRFTKREIKYKIPDISKMDEGVLYFYSQKKPNKLIEDIDL